MDLRLMILALLAAVPQVLFLSDAWGQRRTEGPLETVPLRANLTMLVMEPAGNVLVSVGDDGVIEDAKFKTFGCGSAIASSSLATEWIKGKTLDEASAIENTEIVQELSLPPVKIHCSVLAEDAIKSAIADYKAKQDGETKEDVA